MSWMQKLYRTYEYIQEQGLGDGDLSLPFHMTKAVHLRVVLDDKAELAWAERFEGKMQVSIQVTEKSSKRAGSTIAPYALHDGLQYIAKTAGQYLTIEYLSEVAKKENGKKWKSFLTDSDEKKQSFASKEKKKFDDCFLSYEKQLSEWSQFSSLEEIKIVLQYIQKGTLIDDLIEKKVFSIENNILLSGKDDPFDLTIAWAVNIPGDSHTDLWNKTCVQQKWISYQESKILQDGSQKELCCITGDLDYPTEAYLKIKGNAKLASANDHSGFTFRGRFLGKDDGADSLGRQAVCLGKNASQKAFSTLKWLMNRQGVPNGDQVTVAWAIGSDSVPSPLQDNYDYLDDDADDGQSVEAASDGQKSSKNWSENIGRTAAAIIKKKLHGYRAKLDDHQQISLLMLDSATPGRMALTYYQEFLPDDYFANLDAWVDDFSWYQRYSRESKEGKKNVKRTIWPCLSPSPYAIYETIYGKAADKDGKIKRQLYARLLPVIAGGQTVPMPDDLVRQSFQVACQPSGYEHWEWERNIGVACALYKGWRARHHDSSQQRIYPMDLDIENRSRDYLFGRLLAVAEKLESTALRIADEDRATTAERYMQRFVVRPLSTWMQIEANLTKSYKDRLRNNRYMGFLRNREKEIDEIMFALNELRDKTGCSLDAQLDGEFLLGYHSQKMAYRNQSNAQAQPDTQETETENN